MKTIAIVVVAMLLAGCANVSASLQPEDTTVPEMREASDCVPIVFGLAYGSATFEAARAAPGQLIGDYNAPSKPLIKVRRVQLHDYQFLMFGARCVEVVGE